jgi:alpha-L-rhamnosidase
VGDVRAGCGLARRVRVDARTIEQFTGTTSHLHARYGGIRTWIYYVKNSLTNPDGTTDVNRYGDWNDTGTMGTTDYIGKNSSQSFISSAVWLACLAAAAEIATTIDETEDAALYRRWRTESRTGFLDRFVDPLTASTPNDSQTELSMLFALDIIGAELREPAKALLDEAVRQADGHPTVGLVGASVLFEGLRRAGCWEAAWALLTCRTSPSWGYMIDKGATTTWEHWDGDTRDPAMNSEALLLLAGNINGFLFETIGGIGQAEGSTGFRQIVLRPVVLGDPTEASTWYDCPRGRIESHWVRKDERFTWDITIPPGPDADVQLPDGYGLAASSTQHDGEGSIRLSPGHHTLEAYAGDEGLGAGS